MTRIPLLLGAACIVFSGCYYDDGPPYPGAPYKSYGSGYHTRYGYTDPWEVGYTEPIHRHHYSPFIGAYGYHRGHGYYHHGPSCGCSSCRNKYHRHSHHKHGPSCGCSSCRNKHHDHDKKKSSSGHRSSHSSSSSHRSSSSSRASEWQKDKGGNPRAKRSSSSRSSSSSSRGSGSSSKKSSGSRGSSSSNWQKDKGGNPRAKR